MKSSTFILVTILLSGCATPKSQAPVVQPPASVVVESRSQPNPNELVLSKESLVAVKNEVPNGSVTLKKVVTTNDASVPVQLRTESYEIVRTGPNGQVPDFSPSQVSLALNKELASGAVTAQVVEVVSLKKVTSVQDSTVTGKVRSESIEVVK